MLLRKNLYRIVFFTFYIFFRNKQQNPLWEFQRNTPKDGMTRTALNSYEISIQAEPFYLNRAFKKRRNSSVKSASVPSPYTILPLLDANTTSKPRSEAKSAMAALIF